MQASARGNKEIVELLLDNGADVNWQNVIGATALHHLIEEEFEGKTFEIKLDIAKKLFSKGANPNLIHLYCGDVFELSKRKDLKFYNEIFDLFNKNKEK
jgi:hypothetical protein